MATGKPTDRSLWPETGPVRNLLLFLDKVREGNGREGLRGIAERMHLSPTAVNELLRGVRLPVDQAQLTSLVRALGGGSDEVAKGQELYSKARNGRVRRTRPAVSLYTEYIRQIAPAELHDRTAELGELAAFGSGGPTEHAYLWWQAPAWAGKSALMSWFALHPPPNVDVVSFFVTARFATHNDRWAFLEVVAEQLAALDGARVPLPSRELREAHVTRLLDEAAATRLRRGRRLVLLVDGLDEDQGVSGGPGTYSIAALLPARVPKGLRVVVAGRPHPPIPHDVPDDHPLRRGGVVRHLALSRHAQVVRTAAERDLKRLLHGDAAGQDLLGLVTAAGGGLTRTDLASLTGLPGYEVEDRLHAVTGRAFTTRPGLWQSEEAPDLYALAHEELQVMSKAAFGAAGLLRHRRRLQAWAETYRQRDWPADTPEYLLTDYHGMLRAAAGESGTGAAEAEADMLRCASDAARHNRQLDLSGGDAAAFAEIATAQDFLLGRDHPDLTRMLRLSIHRNELAERNTAMPDCLPAAWAVLGQPHRAEAIARSASDRFSQRRALLSLVEGLAEAGDPTGAEEIARGFPRPEERDEAMAALARGTARAGDVERAEHVAAGIAHSVYRTTALADVARVAATDGESGRTKAKALADSIEETALGLQDGYQRALVWCELAEVHAATGDEARVLAATAEAERAVRAQPEETPWHLAYARLVRTSAAVGDLPRALRITAAFGDWKYRREDMLAGLAKGLAAAGDFDGARTVLDAIDPPAPAGTEPPEEESEEVSALADAFRKAAVAGVTLDLAVALAAAGDHDQAVSLARALPNPAARAEVLASLARELAVVDRARATSWAKEAENAARGGTASSSRARDMATMVRGLARVGDHEAAETLARRVTDTYQQLTALAVVARERRDAGEHEGGIALARMAVSRTGDITSTHYQGVALTALAEVLTEAGDWASAELAVRHIADHEQRALALVTLAKATLRPHRVPEESAGAARRTALLAEDAEHLAQQVEGGEQRCRVLTALAGLAAIRGDLAHAMALARRTERLARTIEDNPPDQQLARRARALVCLGEVLAEHGMSDWARELAEEAEELAHEIHFVLSMALELSCAANLYTALGDHDRADAAIAAIPDLTERAKACAQAIGPAAAGQASAARGGPGSASGPGIRDRVAELATAAETLIDRMHAPHSRVKALAELAAALGKAGAVDRASARVADAEPLVRFLDQELAQAITLASLSDVATPPQRARLLAQALAVGPWQSVVDRLASVAPDAVRTAAVELFG
ncbi:hypothetical protein [Streptomyces sp. NPDC053755]|uniref:hypothetical protein n=1 Tax=Streptomyces sp. NPDC053755 TaxID=3155815 RepID=UPI003443DF33